ncbi:SET domain-containing protein [Jackrogersella minutella]|nr:SET domain-containing protein [Jackrogersella minutella]
MAPSQDVTVDKNGTKSQGMIEVRRLDSTKGEAVFATVNISRGTRIAAEVPLIMIPPTSDNEEVLEFFKASDQVPDDKLSEMVHILCQLSVTESIREDQHIRREAWTFYKNKKWRDRDGNTLQGKKLARAVKKTINLCAIYLTHNVQLGPGGKYGSGVFSLYSRINHSCAPNAHNSWNPTMKRLTLHATQDLKAGDQIFVNYIGHVCRTRQQRAFSLFATWGITCECEACTEPTIDQLRHRMLVTDQALAAYACGASEESNFSAVHGIPRIATPQEALKAAEELVQLLKRQRLYGMELYIKSDDDGRYRECSNYAFDSGLYDKALEYALKELELERLLIGTETGHLQDEPSGAEYWVDHVRMQIIR